MSLALVTFSLLFGVLYKAIDLFNASYKCGLINHFFKKNWTLNHFSMHICEINKSLFMKANFCSCCSEYSSFHFGCYMYSYVSNYAIMFMKCPSSSLLTWGRKTVYTQRDGNVLIDWTYSSTLEPGLSPNNTTDHGRNGEHRLKGEGP